MPDPIIKKQDLLQARPDNINLGAAPNYRLNLYRDDGFGQPDQANTPTVNSASCSIRNITDLDTAISTPTVTISNITNGKQLYFPINTTTSPLNAVGRFVAILTYVFNSETQVEYIFFNVVN